VNGKYDGNGIYRRIQGIHEQSEKPIGSIKAITLKKIKQYVCRRKGMNAPPKRQLISRILESYFSAIFIPPSR
jgi:hypothetical protein